MRATILTSLVMVWSLPVWAGDIEAKAALALALAQTQTLKSKHGHCGKCRLDEKEARADALAEGKPLVLFVGGPCEGQGQIVDKAGGVPLIVPSYDHDGQPKDARRIVVLQPMADGSGFAIDKTLPSETRESVLLTAVAEAKPVPVKGKGTKLNWNN